MVAPHHRHQSSLEDVFSFDPHPSLGANQRINARHRFNSIVQHFNAENNNIKNDYNHSLLLHYTYEFTISEIAQDNFLRAFFGALELSLGEDKDVSFEQVRPKFIAFADYLMDTFFLPCKAFQTSSHSIS